jgi:hypothetical protein
LHFVVVPLAVINSTVLPNIFSLTVDVVLMEISFVGAVIAPDEDSFPSLLSVLVVALINGSILPLLLPIPILLIIFPVPIILCTVV